MKRVDFWAQHGDDGWVNLELKPYKELKIHWTGQLDHLQWTTHQSYVYDSKKEKVLLTETIHWTDSAGHRTRTSVRYSECPVKKLDARASPCSDTVAGKQYKVPAWVITFARGS